MNKSERYKELLKEWKKEPENREPKVWLPRTRISLKQVHRNSGYQKAK